MFCKQYEEWQEAKSITPYWQELKQIVWKYLFWFDIKWETQQICNKREIKFYMAMS